MSTVLGWPKLPTSEWFLPRTLRGWKCCWTISARLSHRLRQGRRRRPRLLRSRRRQCRYRGSCRTCRAAARYRYRLIPRQNRKPEEDLMSRLALKIPIALIVLTSLSASIGAQQAPVPGQPSGTPPNAPATPQLPPSGQTTPPTAKPPVIPRRIPSPLQAPAAQPVPPVPPQAQTPPGPEQQPPGAPTETPPQESVAPPIPQRRAGPSAPSGGMVSLNFNRADLVEIIHIIAQQLRLTYTIDPEVKGTV